MNGEDSSKQIFRSYPKLRVYNYQGSLTSTSEGILKVFNGTRKNLKNNRTRIEFEYNELNKVLMKLKKEWKKIPYEN